jgi:peptidoglycan hydrolase-like protein with peptidoglycan-binding domain
LAVKDLQKALIRKLPLQITVDGIFGRDTRASVIEFQRRAGLVPDGIAGRRTLKALGLG